MPQFRSPLIDNDLGVTTARLGSIDNPIALIARVGISRLAFAPLDTDPLTMPDVTHDGYYAQRDRRVVANPHTVVEP